MRKIGNVGTAILMAVVGAISFVGNLQAQNNPGRAEVRGILGNVTYATAPGAWVPLRMKNVLTSGSIIKTGPRSAVDLFLGKSGGTIRLTENSTLAIRKLTLSEVAGEILADMEFDLQEGTILGSGSKLSQASHFEVKIPTGIIGVGEGQYRINSKGYLVLVDGKMVFVQIAASGEPVPFPMTAPASVYFSPTEGVRPAPSDLVREINLQLKSKLPTK